ncbi:terpenoid synthase [Annulohypoxylon maeteangense]|uniref:terpenoid synthase n=1 Tax=Annulohypoxylon maeteangense TaxID=1927788 RepID=UPI002008C1F4|nr:terpenoid synthase [Annulohypoxylon maeteangense]KAI0889255.1 terpenoid synthase [Annulohypoxylon maeteangense]
MYNYTEKELLVKKLKGQRLSIPDMRPIFSHWPSGQNENYETMKEMIDKRLAMQPMGEEARKAFTNMNPALLAARWWPSASKEKYRTLIEHIIWFGYWDDLVEKLTPDPNAAEDLRRVTKAFIRHSLGLTQPGEEDSIPSNPLVRSFEGIAAETCANYDEEQRKTLMGHFDRYIDATRLEAEADLSDRLPSLKRYWEVRILTSGMGALLGFTEYAAQAKLPLQLASSTAYETLWMTTIIINSIVNDLISFKKEMKAGSVLSSVAILYQQVDNLDAAVQMSVAHLRILVEEFDRVANTILSEFPLTPEEVDAVSKILYVLRTVNTGNLEWSLQSKRYGVSQFMTDDGRIELTL